MPSIGVILKSSDSNLKFLIMSKNENTALELLFSNMVFLEQFVESVTNYTSKYNSVLSILYAPENLIGKPAKYPMYGDFPDTYVLVSTVYLVFVFP